MPIRHKLRRIAVSSAIGALSGCLGLWVTSLPLFLLRPSMFDASHPSDFRVEILYWLVLGAAQSLAFAFTSMLAEPPGNSRSPVQRGVALLLSFLAIPVCVGFGIPLFLSGGLGTLALVGAPLLYGALWARITLLEWGQSSITIALLVGALLPICFLLGQYQYIGLFAGTNAIVVSWRAYKVRAIADIATAA